jgi:hypothetical protein
MTEIVIAVQTAAGRITDWFTGRPLWLKVIVVLLGWPLLLAAHIAKNRSAGLERSDQRASLVEGP